jgi:uncharacterized membrane protein YccC
MDMAAVTPIRGIRDLVDAYRPQLRFCLRVTVAALATFAIGRGFDFPLHGLWAVITAIVVSQVSVGGSLRATIEYNVGTLGGAIFAVAIGLVVPHATPLSQAFVLALAVAPLALAASISPSFRVAPFSAVLVLLIGAELGQSPIASAFTRILEVAIGGAVAVAVSVLVLPDRAHALGLETASDVLNQMADLLPKLLDGISRDVDRAKAALAQNALGRAVTAFQALAVEAKRERIVSLVRDPDPEPLARTLLRLRHDLIIVGRATVSPLPEGLGKRLEPPLRKFAETAASFVRGCAAALAERRPPPSLAEMQTALGAYDSEIASIRSEGLTRTLTTAQVECLFTLGFALEQFCRDSDDLAQRALERARDKGAPDKV